MGKGIPKNLEKIPPTVGDSGRIYTPGARNDPGVLLAEVVSNDQLYHLILTTFSLFQQSFRQALPLSLVLPREWQLSSPFPLSQECLEPLH